MARSVYSHLIGLVCLLVRGGDGGVRLGGDRI